MVNGRGPQLPSTLLQPRHLTGGFTRLMPEHGLVLDQTLDQETVDVFVGEYAAPGACLPRPARCTINPRDVPLQRFVAVMKRAQRQALREDLDDPVGVRTDSPGGSYEWGWSLQDDVLDEESIAEGQSLVTVCRRGRAYAGFADWRAVLFRTDDDQTLHLSLAFNLVYVAPRLRGQGFGMALSVATAWAAADVLEGIYRAAPAGARLSTVIHADYESAGGEAFCEQVRREMAITVHELSLAGGRPVSVDPPDMDASY